MDRAALDVAWVLGLSIGDGPQKVCLSKNGTIADKYSLNEPPKKNTPNGRNGMFGIRMGADHHGG